MGFFIMLVTALAFAAGWLRNELAITLLGTVFLTILVYCFLGTLLLGIVNRKKARSLSMSIVADTVDIGKEGELSIKTAGKKFLRLPAILIRCELCLETRDGRLIRCFADPEFPAGSRKSALGHETICAFGVKERGAYFGEYDRFVTLDAPGFFSLALPIHQSKGPRLFAVPNPTEEQISLRLKSGGDEERSEPHYRKSDEFIDHRPYVPGDDPRRINWKLYSHAPLGELFVREGEPEPPPHSRLLILVDSEIDSSLYTVDEGRRAVDLLCENALTAALEFSGRGMDISIGWTGGEIIGDKTEGGPLNAVELASALAWPAAVFPQPLPEEVSLPWVRLPEAPDDRAVLILALPRAFSGVSSRETSALDSFLKNRKTKQEADVIFIYDTENRKAAALEENARVCVNLYSGRTGVHAGKAAVSRSWETETR